MGAWTELASTISIPYSRSVIEALTSDVYAFLVVPTKEAFYSIRVKGDRILYDYIVSQLV